MVLHDLPHHKRTGLLDYSLILLDALHYLTGAYPTQTSFNQSSLDSRVHSRVLVHGHHALSFVKLRGKAGRGWVGTTLAELDLLETCICLPNGLGLSQPVLLSRPKERFRFNHGIHSLFEFSLRFGLHVADQHAVEEVVYCYPTPETGSVLSSWSMVGKKLVKTLNQLGVRLEEVEVDDTSQVLLNLLLRFIRFEINDYGVAHVPCLLRVSDSFGPEICVQEVDASNFNYSRVISLGQVCSSHADFGPGLDFLSLNLVVSRSTLVKGHYLPLLVGSRSNGTSQHHAPVGLRGLQNHELTGLLVGSFGGAEQSVHWLGLSSKSGVI